jgi:hypothetical protein
MDDLNLWNETPSEGETDHPFKNREEAFLDEVRAFRIVKWLVRTVNFGQDGDNDDVLADSLSAGFDFAAAEAEFRARLLRKLKEALWSRGSKEIIVGGSTRLEGHVEFIS